MSHFNVFSCFLLAGRGSLNDLIKLDDKLTIMNVN